MAILHENGERQGKGRAGDGPALRNAVRRATFAIRPSSGA
jgi:hypothetical protein